MRNFRERIIICVTDIVEYSDSSPQVTVATNSCETGVVPLTCAHQSTRICKRCDPAEVKILLKRNHALGCAFSVLHTRPISVI